MRLSEAIQAGGMEITNWEDHGTGHVGFRAQKVTQMVGISGVEPPIPKTITHSLHKDQIDLQENLSRRQEC